MRASSKHFGRFGVVVLALCALLSGCRDARVYDHYEPVSDEGWGRNDTVRFAVPRQKQGRYAVNLGLRFNHRYPYRGVSLIVNYEQLPSHRTAADTVQLRLLTDKGQPAGRVGITSASVATRLRELSLQEGDSLYITVHHNMRRDQLTGINDVGLQLVKE